MDLNKLFKAQAELDRHIVGEKGLQGQDLLDKKILALQVELGELANEWRGFKFWSEKQSPNKGQSIPIECGLCDGVGIDTFGVFNVNERCSECDGTGLSGECHQEPNPLLEEYVDCLHFILSIGNEIEITDWDNDWEDGIKFENITEQFNFIYKAVGGLMIHNYEKEQRPADDEMFLILEIINDYRLVLGTFLHLGEMLEFSLQQIEQAYFEKNNTNHERQANGY